jgi:hypothetical protein
MEDQKEKSPERRMEMRKKMEELLNTMDEKELRSFIKGYMLGEMKASKRMKHGCGRGSCNCNNASTGCGCEGCCGKEGCNCRGREE